jgi:hypothetical protein
MNDSRWSKSRSLANVITIPKDRDQDFEGGSIDFISINYATRPIAPTATFTTPNPSKLLILAVSLRLGRSVIFAPFPHHFARPLSTYYLNNLTDALRGSIRYTSFTVSTDGSKLIWGMSDGSLRITYTGLRDGREGRGIEGSNNVKLRSGDRIIQGHRRNDGISSADQISAIAIAGHGPDGDKKLFVSAEGAPGVLAGIGRRKVIIWKLMPPRLDDPFALSIWSRIIPTPVLSSTTSTRYTTPVTSTLLASTGFTSTPATPVITSRFDRLILESQSSSIVSKIALSEYELPLSSTSSTKSTRHVVVLGMNNGDVHIWINIDLVEKTLGALPSTESEERYHYFLADQLHDKNSDDRDIDPNSLFLRPIDTLILDTLSSSTTNSIELLVHRLDDKVFHRYSFNISVQGSSVSFSNGFTPGVQGVEHDTFGHGEELGVITCIKSDFALPPEYPNRPEDDDDDDDDDDNQDDRVRGDVGKNSFGRIKYVVTGDDQGRVFVWNWEERVDDSSTLIKARKILQRGEIKVTAIELGQGMIFVGG